MRCARIQPRLVGIVRRVGVGVPVWQIGIERCGYLTSCRRCHVDLHAGFQVGLQLFFWSRGCGRRSDGAGIASARRRNAVVFGSVVFNTRLAAGPITAMNGADQRRCTALIRRRIGRGCLGSTAGRHISPSIRAGRRKRSRCPRRCRQRGGWIDVGRPITHAQRNGGSAGIIGWIWRLGRALCIDVEPAIEIDDVVRHLKLERAAQRRSLVGQHAA